jgi:predicted RNA-binding Zn-ribbon protein involved in translation (DUF1610 family)
MSSELKCLRCSSAMELGRLAHREQVFPILWWKRQAPEPSVQGALTIFGIGLMSLSQSQAENARRKAKKAELLQQRTYVDAYRCPNCGHVELLATQAVVNDTQYPS